MSANIFSSLSGSYNYVNDMSNLISDYSSIKNGSYGSLMKSYVNKVGNKAALNAYRETGSTTTAAESSTSTASASKKTSSSKSSFLDSHLSSIGKSTESSSTSSTKKSFLDSHLDSVLGTGKNETASDTKTSEAASTSTATATATDAATTADKYAKYKSSWLDDQLKQYDKDANKTTAANTSVAYDTTV